MGLLQPAVEIAGAAPNPAAMTLEAVPSPPDLDRSQSAVMALEAVSSPGQIKIPRRPRGLLQITNKALRQQQTRMTQTAMVERWGTFLICASCPESFECSITPDYLTFDYLTDNCQTHVYALLLLLCLLDLKMSEQAPDTTQPSEQAPDTQPSDRRNSCYTFGPGEAVHSRTELEVTAWLREHDNKTRLSPQAFSTICYYLRNPQATAPDQTERNLKSRAKRGFVLKRGILHHREFQSHNRQRVGEIGSKRVVEVQWVYQFVMDEHTHHGHGGRDRIWPIIRDKYYGISQTEVNYILATCEICQESNPVAAKGPLRQIKANFVMERCQMDLMDYRNQPDGLYKWILHVKVSCPFIVLDDGVRAFC